MCVEPMPLSLRSLKVASMTAPFKVQYETAESHTQSLLRSTITDTPPTVRMESNSLLCTYIEYYKVEELISLRNLDLNHETT